MADNSRLIVDDINQFELFENDRCFFEKTQYRQIPEKFLSEKFQLNKQLLDQQLLLNSIRLSQSPDADTDFDRLLQSRHLWSPTKVNQTEKMFVSEMHTPSVLKTPFLFPSRPFFVDKSVNSTRANKIMIPDQICGDTWNEPINNNKAMNQNGNAPLNHSEQLNRSEDAPSIQCEDVELNECNQFQFVVDKTEDDARIANCPSTINCCVINDIDSRMPTNSHDTAQMYGNMRLYSSRQFTDTQAKPTAATSHHCDFLTTLSSTLPNDSLRTPMRSRFGTDIRDEPQNDDEQKLLIANAEYDRATFVDTHCHFDLMNLKLRHFSNFEEIRKNYSSTFPRTYEGCIVDWCDPTIFGTREHVNETSTWWWRTMQVDQCHSKIPCFSFVEEKSVLGAAYGCHPHLSHLYNNDVHSQILKLIQNDVSYGIPTVAVGEAGLDFSYKNRNSAKVQELAYVEQLKMAQNSCRPLLIHCRGGDANDTRGNAEELCLQLTKQYLSRDHFIHRHCFTLGIEAALKWVREFPNLYIGLTPLIFYVENNAAVLQVAEKLRLDRILIETDSPFFMPKFYKSVGVPKGGHPGGGINVALKLADLRKMSVQHVLLQCRKNTKEIYGI